MTRIACLFVPLFPLAARLRAEPELAGQELVICEGNGSAARVVSASRPARKSGVRPGMSLAQARSLLPSILARGRDPVCEASAHEALLEATSSLSPRIEDSAPDAVFADVSGMERLYDGAAGEHDMGQAAVVAAESLDLPVRVGIAGNKLAARIAARRPDTPQVVPAGEEARFLAPLPVAHLDLDRRIEGTLRRWGIRTLGELARLPADRTASRLGPAGVSAHRAARGLDSSPLAPFHPPPVLREGMELEWPVVTVDPLLYALRRSLERTRQRLEREDRAWAMLELELGLEPEGSEQRQIRLPAPTRDTDALLALVRLELESRPPRAPVISFMTLTHPDRPRRGQLTLFGSPEIHPDKLASTLARLAARLGPDRVGSPRPVDSHLPEHYDSVSFDPPPSPTMRRGPRRGRGLLVVRVLRPPVPLEVITETEDFGFRISDFGLPLTPPDTSIEVQDEARDATLNSQDLKPTREPAASSCPIQTRLPPSSREEQKIPNPKSQIPNQDSFLRLVSLASEPGATPRIQGLVRVAAGPWAVQDGWWSEQPVERDYWDVELSGGRLVRIFRDRTTGDWFADGMYD